MSVLRTQSTISASSKLKKLEQDEPDNGSVGIAKTHRRKMKTRLKKFPCLEDSPLPLSHNLSLPTVHDF